MRAPFRSARSRWRRPSSLSCLVLALALALTTAPLRMASAEPVTIGTSTTGLLVWIAEAFGLFEKHGVEVRVEEVHSGVEAARRTLSGELTLGTSSEFALTSMVMTQPGLCAYATISSSRTTRLLARADRVGLAPQDLVGKRIAVTRKAVGQFFLWQYLRISGIPEGSVTLVDLGPNEIVTAILDGSVDAAMTWEPHVSRIRQALGGRVVEYPDQSDQYFYFVLQGRCALADERPEMLRAVLAALIEAEQLERDQPERVEDALLERLGFDRPAYVQMRPLHSLQVMLPQGLLFLMEREAEWRIREGLSAGPVPDVLSIVRPEPLEAVAPHSVQMIH